MDAEPPDAAARAPGSGGAEGDAEADDLELLRRHVAGDQDAFAVLVRRHSGRVWAVAIGILRDREDAADAVQEAMVSALRAAGSFRGDAAVATWLHRIVVNACLDRMRRRKAHPTVALTPDDEAAIPSPGDPMAASEDRVAVRAALARLPEAQRAALVLVDVEQRPVAEAARMLEVPVGTVKSRCARARAQLAVMLGYLRPGNPAAFPDVSEGERPDGPAVSTVPGEVIGDGS